jgi:hypothetical protein
MCSWQTGAQFGGMKMIPPGLHIVYFTLRAQDRSGDVTKKEWRRLLAYYASFF